MSAVRRKVLKLHMPSASTHTHTRTQTWAASSCGPIRCPHPLPEAALQPPPGTHRTLLSLRPPPESRTLKFLLPGPSVRGKCAQSNTRASPGNTLEYTPTSASKRQTDLFVSRLHCYPALSPGVSRTSPHTGRFFPCASSSSHHVRLNRDVKNALNTVPSI